MSVPPAKFEIIGHRGGGAGNDENTLASCRTAIRNGATRLEVDVYLEDGELLAAHPPRRRSDTLHNILTHIKVPLVVHIKRVGYRRAHDRQVLDALVPLVAGRDVTVSSFWPGTLRYAKRRYPKLRTALVTPWAGYDVHFAPYLGVAELHGWYRTTTRRTVVAAHAKSLVVVAFVPPGRQKTAHHLMTLGVDGVITDEVRAYAEHAAKRRLRIQ